MLRQLFSAFLIVLCLNLQAQDIVSGRTALLMVHFGTTYDEARQQSIEAINDKMRQAFPQMEVRDCFSSRIVVKRLKARGVEKDLPLDAILRLRAEGFTHLVVQPTYVIDGVEMDMLRREIEQVRPFFEDIKVGTPLLYQLDDTRKVVDILTRRHVADGRKREHVVFVGHGTPSPANALYCEIDYMLKAMAHANYHVATIEGYPTQDDALRLIKAAKGRQVTLVPFLFVAGDHAANDISKDWKEMLENEGLTVRLDIEGLGQVPDIQDIYIQKVKTLIQP